METADLQLKTGQMDLTPKENPVRKRFKDFLTDFQVLDDIFILVTYRDEAEAKTFARKLGRALTAQDEVKEVFVRLDLETLMEKFLYLIDEDKLRKLTATLEENGSLLRDLTRKQDLKTLLSRIADRMKPDAKAPPDLDKVSEDLKLVLAVLEEMTLSMSAPGRRTTSLWRSIFMPPGDDDRIYDEEGYIISRRAKKLLLMVKSSRALSSQDEVIRYFTKVKSVVESVEDDFPGVSVGYAGSPAITYDEKNTVEGDMLFSTLLSLSGISLLFVLSLQSFVHPFLGVTTLVIGLIWTFGLTRIVVGHLTLVSSAFTATLIGIGIGFGIHIVTCYEEERARGADNDRAIAAALAGTGPGVITGATTSAAAFYTMMLTEFTAFQELGFIAGSGLLIAMLDMLVLLPALLTVKARLFPGHGGAMRGFLADAVPSQEARPWLAALGRFCGENAVTISLLFGMAIIASIPMALTIGFDYNLLNLQASSSRAVLNEHELVDDFNISPEFNAVIVPDLKSAHEVTKRLRTFSSVARVESIADLLPDDLDERKAVIDPVRPIVASLETKRLKPPMPDPYEITDILGRISKSVKALRLYALFKGKHSLVMMSSRLENEISNWRLAFGGLPYEVALDRLRSFQQRLFDDLMNDMSLIRRAFAAEPYTIDSLPRSLKSRFIGKSGRFVVYVFPSIDVRQEMYARRFIEDTASLGRDFTGLPVIKNEMVNLIRRGFYNASLYAFAALSLMVYLDFRRLPHSAMVLFSLFGGTVFMLSGMFVMGIKFNPANFVALPIILGIGVDNGVHIMQRFLGGANLMDVLLRTGRAVTLNSLTTMIGFGSLAMSSYQGFSTLGLIMVAGVLSCYATAMVFQPSLMHVFLVDRRSFRRRLSELVSRILSFRY